MKKSNIEESQLLRVVKLLGDINHLFHQPLYYEDVEFVKKFADKFYPEIHDLYYNIVWEWLTNEVREEIEDGGSIEEVMERKKIFPLCGL